MNALPPIGSRIEFRNKNHLIPAATIHATVTGLHDMGDGVHGHLKGQVWVESVDDEGRKHSRLAGEVRLAA